MANTPPPSNINSLYPDATKPGPIHPIDPPDLLGTGAAISDVSYTLAPRERDAWQFAVDQAGMVAAACSDTLAHGIAEINGFDGPYNVDTSQPGIPCYGMAGDPS